MNKSDMGVSEVSLCPSGPRLEMVFKSAVGSLKGRWAGREGKSCSGPRGSMVLSRQSTSFRNVRKVPSAKFVTAARGGCEDFRRLNRSDIGKLTRGHEADRRGDAIRRRLGTTKVH